RPVVLKERDITFVSGTADIRAKDYTPRSSLGDGEKGGGGGRKTVSGGGNAEREMPFHLKK
ncbi:hypothetical protein KUCAC02_035982, partial [Chaenocephalus aceratus]